MAAPPINLEHALAATRTGDLWVFRGRTIADRAIQVSTNSPVNHVGMAVVIDDLPPLMWHAELGRSLLDLWSGTHQRGAQLHDLRDAVTTWGNRYGQKAWLRQLDHPVDAAMEDAVLETIARLDGTPFPSTTQMATRWVRSRLPRLPQLPHLPDVLHLPDLPGVPRALQARAEAQEVEAGQAEADLETAYCAEIVAVTYEAMGLIAPGRRPSWFDPGTFWSGDGLPLLGGARLGREIAVAIPVRRPDALAERVNGSAPRD